MMEKIFGESAANVENGFYSIIIIVLLTLGLFVLGKFGRRGDKGGNPPK